MKALIVSDLHPDFAGVALGELPDPQPQAGEVVLRVEAAALGFPDLLMTHGGYQHKPELPFVPGMEMAGEVVAVGDGVAHFQAGDKVTAGGFGGFAELFCADQSRLRKIPEGLSMAEAAAFGSAYLTAYVSLVRRAALQKGEWLLVHGAAGGVGLAAVELGKHLGAKVIATASSDAKLAAIEAHCAPDALINIHDGFRDRVKQLTGGGADVIYDPVGGDVFDESVRCIGWGGRLLVVGFADGRIPDISVNLPLIKGFSIVGVRAGEYGRRDPQKGAENMDRIWQMAASGALRPHIHDIVPLADWRRAFEMMRARHVVGRVIIAPQK